MSLDKAIEHGKEHRKQYTDSRAIDYSCRNHGDCTYCRENRLHKFRDKYPLDDGEVFDVERFGFILDDGMGSFESNVYLA